LDHFELCSERPAAHLAPGLYGKWLLKCGERASPTLATINCNFISKLTSKPQVACRSSELAVNSHIVGGDGTLANNPLTTPESWLPNIMQTPIGQKLRMRLLVLSLQIQVTLVSSEECALCASLSFWDIKDIFTELIGSLRVIIYCWGTDSNITHPPSSPEARPSSICPIRAFL
jgi:hypothetical protein